MKIYNVVFKATVFDEIAAIKDFIVSVASKELALKYVDELEQEVYALSYLAPCVSDTDSSIVKQYHPNARKIITHNKKWTIIFHIDGDYVIIDKIIPSKMIIA